MPKVKSVSSPIHIEEETARREKTEILDARRLLPILSIAKHQYSKTGYFSNPDRDYRCNGYRSRRLRGIDDSENPFSCIIKSVGPPWSMVRSKRQAPTNRRVPTLAASLPATLVRLLLLLLMLLQDGGRNGRRWTGELHASLWVDYGDGVASA